MADWSTLTPLIAFYVATVGIGGSIVKLYALRHPEGNVKERGDIIVGFLSGLVPLGGFLYVYFKDDRSFPLFLMIVGTAVSLVLMMAALALWERLTAEKPVSDAAAEPVD